MSSRTPGRARTSRATSGSSDDGLLGPEQVGAVAAGAADGQDVRVDRRERPDVLLELGLGCAVRDPLHHHAARGQVLAAGLVVLLRRDDRGARALDGRRRVGDDDVEPLVAELQVVAAVGDDDPAVRVGRDLGRVRVVPAEHVGHGRHELDDVGRAARRSAPTGRPCPSRTRRRGRAPTPGGR